MVRITGSLNKKTIAAINAKYETEEERQVQYELHRTKTEKRKIVTGAKPGRPKLENVNEEHETTRKLKHAICNLNYWKNRTNEYKEKYSKITGNSFDGLRDYNDEKKQHESEIVEMRLRHKEEISRMIPEDYVEEYDSIIGRQDGEMFDLIMRHAGFINSKINPIN